MVYTIVTCFNQVEKLRECLAALLKQNFAGLTILVVDDGSIDGTAEFLRSKEDVLEYITGDGTLFWGGGVAYGYEYVRERLGENDYVLLVNCDSVLETGCVSALVDFLQSESNCVIAHALTLNSSDRETVIGSGSLIKNWPLFITQHPLRGQKLGSVTQIPQKVHTVTARALMIPEIVVRRIGFIDDSTFRHYGGDSDFGVRCYNKGVQPYIIPTAICYLDVQSTGVSSMKSNGNIAAQLKGLFSLRSANNLVSRWRFGRNCPPVWRPFYFASAIAKVFGGIFSSYAIYKFKKRLK